MAGADIAFELGSRASWPKGEGRAIAGVIVYRFPEMQEVRRASAIESLKFPYVPGLLSFREIPVLLRQVGCAMSKHLLLRADRRQLSDCQK